MFSRISTGYQEVCVRVCCGGGGGGGDSPIRDYDYLWSVTS